MSQQSPPPVGGPNIDLRVLEDSTTKIEKELAELRSTQRNARRLLWLVILVLVAELTIFGFATYRRVRANFQPENIQAAVQEVMPSLQPVLTRHVTELVKEAGPVYQELARERLEEIGPELTEEFADRARELPKESYADVRDLVEAALNNVVSTAEPEIKATFPSLTEEEQLERLVEHYQIATHKEADQLRSHLDSRFQSELKRVNDAMVRFDVPPKLEKKSQFELQRLMLHHLVMLLDDTIMTEEPLPEAEIAGPVEPKEG